MRTSLCAMMLLMLSPGGASALCTSSTGCGDGGVGDRQLLVHGSVDLTGNDTIRIGQTDLGLLLHSIGACINGNYYTLKYSDAEIGPGALYHNSYFCSGAGDDIVSVLSNPSSSPYYCDGVPMYALNYNGYQMSLFGQAGADDLYGGSGPDMLCGGSENDELEGSFGDDELDGWTGDDRIRGVYGNADRSYGYSGDDRIWDYSGTSDQLDGESGTADCVFDQGGSFSYLGCGNNGANDKSPNSSGTSGCVVSWCSYT